MNEETAAATYGEVKADIPERDVEEIPRAESRLAEAIGSLYLGLGELESKLDRVLRMAETEPGYAEKELAVVRPATAPLTDFLSTQTSRVEAECVRVNDLLRRLAL